VRNGALAQGERLPAVRPLAATLGVNRSTVLKASRALGRAGGLTTVKGGPLLFCNGRTPGRLRLNLAAQPEERIEYGIKRLARCIEEETR
jgi:DNA-binding transcriptional MocR family regulator